MDFDRFDRFHLSAVLLMAALALTLVNTAMLVSEAPEPSPDQEEIEQFSFPTGTPADYGDALGVSFDDVSQDSPEKAQQAIREMASHEDITLEGQERNRYISILYQMDGGISCEYCCEAESIVTAEGDSACGCAHAAAMRGLTKYLLTETDMTDQEIQEEVSKWKTKFFPEQTQAKADMLQENGVQLTPVTLSVNEYQDVGSDSGGWVGDC